MTRTRIVKGTITEKTGGNEIYFAEGNIVINAGEKINITSGSGISFNEPKKSPPIPSFLKCKVEFRPSKDWKGEFGIDWNRKADSQMPVDNSYSKIVGKYGNIYATQSGSVFTFNSNLYNKHLLEYEMFLVDGFSKYYEYSR